MTRRKQKSKGHRKLWRSKKNLDQKAERSLAGRPVTDGLHPQRWISGRLMHGERKWTEVWRLLTHTFTMFNIRQCHFFPSRKFIIWEVEDLIHLKIALFQGLLLHGCSLNLSDTPSKYIIFMTFAFIRALTALQDCGERTGAGVQMRASREVSEAFPVFCRGEGKDMRRKRRKSAEIRPSGLARVSWCRLPAATERVLRGARVCGGCHDNQA